MGEADPWSGGPLGAGDDGLSLLVRVFGESRSSFDAARILNPCLLVLQRERARTRVLPRWTAARGIGLVSNITAVEDKESLVQNVHCNFHDVACLQIA